MILSVAYLTVSIHTSAKEELNFQADRSREFLSQEFSLKIRPFFSLTKQLLLLITKAKDLFRSLLNVLQRAEQLLLLHTDLQLLKMQMKLSFLLKTELKNKVLIVNLFRRAEFTVICTVCMVTKAILR